MAQELPGDNPNPAALRRADPITNRPTTYPTQGEYFKDIQQEQENTRQIQEMLPPEHPYHPSIWPQFPSPNQQEKLPDWYDPETVVPKIQRGDLNRTRVASLDPNFNPQPGTFNTADKFDWFSTEGTKALQGPSEFLYHSELDNFNWFTPKSESNPRLQLMEGAKEAYAIPERFTQLAELGEKARDPEKYMQEYQKGIREEAAGEVKRMMGPTPAAWATEMARDAQFIAENPGHPQAASAAFGLAITAMTLGMTMNKGGPEAPSEVQLKPNILRTAMDRVDNPNAPMVFEGQEPQGEAEFGIFGGPGAKGIKAARKAGETFRGHEGKEKFEINDEFAKWGTHLTGDQDWVKAFKPGGFYNEPGVYNQNPVTIPLWKILDHGDLYRQYPEIRNLSFSTIPKEVVPGVENLTKAAYDPFNKTIRLREDLVGTDEGLSSIGHELQHWIQDKEGFAAGGNTEVMKKAMNSLMLSKGEARAGNKIQENFQDILVSTAKEIDPNFEGKGIQDVRGWMYDTLQKIKAVEPANAQGKLSSEFYDNFLRITGGKSYERLGGEVEAENVVKRFGMTKAQRKETSAKFTEEFPGERQIIIPSKRGTYDPGPLKEQVEKANKLTKVEPQEVVDMAKDMGLKYSMKLSGGKNPTTYMTLTNDEGKSIKVRLPSKVHGPTALERWTIDTSGFAPYKGKEKPGQTSNLAGEGYYNKDALRERIAYIFGKEPGVQRGMPLETPREPVRAEMPAQGVLPLSHLPPVQEPSLAARTKLWEAVDATKTMAETAKRLDMSPSTLSKYLNSKEWQRPEGGSVGAAKTPEELIHDRPAVENMTVKELRQEYQDMYDYFRKGERHPDMDKSMDIRMARINDRMMQLEDIMGKPMVPTKGNVNAARTPPEQIHYRKAGVSGENLSRTDTVVRDLYDKGWSQKQIADYTKMEPADVRNLLLRLQEKGQTSVRARQGFEEGKSSGPSANNKRELMQKNFWPTYDKHGGNLKAVEQELDISHSYANKLKNTLPRPKAAGAQVTPPEDIHYNLNPVVQAERIKEGIERRQSFKTKAGGRQSPTNLDLETFWPTLDRHEGNVKNAAKELGISYSYAYKLKNTLPRDANFENLRRKGTTPKNIKQYPPSNLDKIVGGK